MPKVTFFLGLAGSGKTYYSERMARETGARVFESLLGDHKVPELMDCLRDGIDAVVEEIAFCSSQGRSGIRAALSTIPGLQIEWFCLENDKDSANWNVERRTNKRDVAGHLAINEHWHNLYTYPAGAKVIPLTRLADTSGVDESASGGAI